MKITFPCTRCGKLLKAREDAVGRTRKCPVCAARVTCPEPVYTAQVVDAGVVDAEVVDAEVVAVGPPVAESPPVNPYADIDDDTYAVVAPAPGESSQPEARRVCPMCGELILATAVKCRFCGEVFDEVLKKGKGKRSSRRSTGAPPAAVRDLGIGILLMVLGLTLTGVSKANAVPDSQGGGRYVIFTGLIFGGIGGIIRGIYHMVRSD
jgi:DNA-directed RNA polymerase subunit M/transcription elongation factor TFIIS